ncbi:MAG TPA: alpha-L-fucosidase [Bacteroidota bacterium]|nr:alpha-L-fucosidase [Bacteroidota bacterium]
MRHSLRTMLRGFTSLALVLSFAVGQENPVRHGGNVVLIPPGETLDDIVHQAAHVVPSERQWDWQQREFIGFFHFGMNTFVHREWGDGTANPELFRPSALDADQWVRVAKAAGMKTVILTTKHHDGFCLWPSKYTDYSVRNSPWENGKGDVVKELSEACRKAGLKFGVYLSPWDRHEPSYGDSPKYNEHFRNQLRELLSNYGEIAEVWFDGANGEGPNGKRQVYDWQSYYRLIRELQPEAVIAIMGPDVRWVGTESGYGRETEWSVLPGDQFDVDSVAAHSQQRTIDAAFVPHDLTQQDLGSRERLAHARSLIWYPAETDVSIRPGWFFHANEDSLVKSPETLVDIYYSSVGRNSVLLLNIPPDTSGRISPVDSASVCGMRRILDRTFSVNLLAGANVVASSQRVGMPAMNVLKPDAREYWTTSERVDTAQIVFDLSRQVTVDRAMIKEAIRIGQRIERFHIDAREGASWVRIAEGTTIGYERILRFPRISASSFRLVIARSRDCPALDYFGLFLLGE